MINLNIYENPFRFSHFCWRESLREWILGFSPNFWPCPPSADDQLVTSARMYTTFSSGNTFLSHFPAQETPLPFFEESKVNLAFKTNVCQFWLKYISSWDANFSKNLSRIPQFQAKKSGPEPLILKTWAAHTFSIFCRLPPRVYKLSINLIMSNLMSSVLTKMIKLYYLIVSSSGWFSSSAVTSQNYPPPKFFQKFDSKFWVMLQ